MRVHAAAGQVNGCPFCPAFVLLCWRSCWCREGVMLMWTTTRGGLCCWSGLHICHGATLHLGKTHM